jgi:hypothetical protein
MCSSEYLPLWFFPQNYLFPLEFYIISGVGLSMVELLDEEGGVGGRGEER